MSFTCPKSARKGTFTNSADLEGYLDENIDILPLCRAGNKANDGGASTLFMAADTVTPVVFPEEGVLSFCMDCDPADCLGEACGMVTYVEQD